jgi:hypothetical protein
MSAKASISQCHECSAHSAPAAPVLDDLRLVEGNPVGIRLPHHIKEAHHERPTRYNEVALAGTGGWALHLVQLWGEPNDPSADPSPGALATELSDYAAGFAHALISRTTP